MRWHTAGEVWYLRLPCYVLFTFGNWLFYFSNLSFKVDQIVAVNFHDRPINLSGHKSYQCLYNVYITFNVIIWHGSIIPYLTYDVRNDDVSLSVPCSYIQTVRHTYRQNDCNTSHLSQGRRKNTYSMYNCTNVASTVVAQRVVMKAYMYLW